MHMYITANWDVAETDTWAYIESCEYDDNTWVNKWEYVRMVLATQYT